MRVLALLPLLAACSSLPADTSSADRALAKAVEGRTAGTPQRCIDRSVSGPQIIDARTLIYTQSGRRIWINTLPAACPALRPDSVLIVQAFGSGMCENDQFQARQPSQIIAGPICRFGKFTPFDKAKR